MVHLWEEESGSERLLGGAAETLKIRTVEHKSSSNRFFFSTARQDE